MLRNFQFRIYPSLRQEFTLENWLASLCRTYNKFLADRKNYKQTGRVFTAYSQSYELPTLKQMNPDLALVPAHACQEMSDRLHKAFQAFFRRRKSGENPGFPRFKPLDRFNSLTLIQKGWKHTPGVKRCQGRLEISKLGSMPVKDWKLLPESSKVKQVTLKRHAGQWFAVFCCDLPSPKPLAKIGKAIGLDVGLKSLVMDSNGKSYGDLKPLKKKELKLRKIQKELSRKKNGSNRRFQAKTKVSKAYASLTKAKVYQLHQIANELVRMYDLIAVENLNVQDLRKKKSSFSRGLHRNIGLASWATFFALLSYKAEEAGRTFVKVDPRGTSQECSSCGVLVLKDLSVRTHVCTCGLSMDRDQNAARNILKRALQAPRGGGPTGAPGSRKGQLRRKSSRARKISL
jgi:putative transposase